jgi:hypothetical protein
VRQWPLRFVLMLTLAAGAADAATTAPAATAPPEHHGGRVDDETRRDGEHRPRRDRFRHHDEFGPPTIPAGVQVPSWNELTPAQQQALEHLRATWDQLPASRRVHALERMERHARWEALTPEQRERLRDGARNFRDLPPELREKMRASLQATRALPADERRRLFDRWHELSPEQRRTWLEAGGPGLSPEPDWD